MKKAQKPDESRYSIEYIEWDDAGSPRMGWISTDYAKEFCRTLLIRSCGFLIKETKDHVLLTSHFNEEGEYVHTPMSIPKSRILKRKRIR